MVTWKVFSSMDYVTIINYLFIPVKYWNQLLKKILKGNYHGNFILINNFNFKYMNRFTGNSKLVKSVFIVIQKCFNECNVQLFNDVATNAINIIYNVSTVCYLL